MTSGDLTRPPGAAHDVQDEAREKAGGKRAVASIPFVGGWSSESAIYGLILVSALIIVTDTDQATSGSVMLKVAGTIVVFWLAHAFAEVLARLSRDSTTNFRFWSETRHALRHAAGLPLAAIVPLGILLLGAFTPIRDETAIWAVLWVDILLLAGLGYWAARGMTARPWQRLGIAALTAVLGAVLMLLKALIH